MVRRRGRRLDQEGIQETEADRLANEQASWFAQPKQERLQFPGEYVAVCEGQVIDHDKDQRTLTLRVRSRSCPGQVLIIHSDWDETPVFRFIGTHLDRE